MELDMQVKTLDGSIKTGFATIAFLHGKEDRCYEQWYGIETFEKLNDGLAFFSNKLLSGGKDILVGNKEYIKITAELLK
jgi:hypothetical protein